MRHAVKYQEVSLQFCLYVSHNNSSHVHSPANTTCLLAAVKMFSSVPCVLDSNGVSQSSKHCTATCTSRNLLSWSGVVFGADIWLGSLDTSLSTLTVNDGSVGRAVEAVSDNGELTDSGNWHQLSWSGVVFGADIWLESFDTSLSTLTVNDGSVGHAVEAGSDNGELVIRDRQLLSVIGTSTSLVGASLASVMLMTWWVLMWGATLQSGWC